MSYSKFKVTAVVVCGFALAGTLAIASPADAAMKRHHHYSKHMARMSPARQKPGYVGAPGFAGGPPVSYGPAPVVNNGLLGGGGFLGAGILPQTGIFTGVPIVGQVGL